MYAVKILNEKENRKNSFNKSVDNVISYIKEKLNSKDVKTISDNNCVEIVSGNESVETDNSVVAEFYVKKIITIDKDKISDKAELDKFLANIKHFCKSAEDIESFQYEPITFRKKKKINGS